MRSNKQSRVEKKLKYASARKRAEQKQREASFSATYLKLPQGVKLFKPKEGVMLIDILPFRAGENNPCADEGLLHYERTYHLHARVGADGGHSYLCPRLTRKERCPVCEYRQNLLKKSDPDDEKLIKDTAPKERQLFNVINLKEPDKGIQVWDISYHLFGKILDARIRNSDEDEGWDQFASLEGGMTLKIGFKERSFAGHNFLEAETIDFKPRAEDYDEDTLEQTHCLDELLIEPEYDELKKVFLEAVGPEAEGEDDETDDEDERRVLKKKAKKAVDDDEDDEDDDEDEEPAPKSTKKKTSKDTFDDFEDDEEEDDDEEKSKKKSSPKDDDDDEDEDEDEEPAPAPVARKRKSRAKVRPDPEEEEDNDEAAELPRIRSKKQIDEDEEDEEADDEDEDEEPAPRRRR